ncbi:MAG: hypothetical protein KVP17_004651 [Porospora cf. gigantea B]|uniref:uncharacterized protein n=1 Tax=Porospora cf. gigantea B TaxID=2853592 RepID=UPI003571F243|nr:MAG: hypothetical protein KVP17_004651 [Porospora cf. gigantea B]
MKQAWKDIVMNAPDALNLGKIRKQLEGPVPLRAAAGLIGLAMALTSMIGFLNIFSLIGSPAKFILQIYEFFFGVAIFVVEIKDFKGCGKLRRFIMRWFPFTSIVGGKGLLMLQAGLLGISFGWTNLLVFVPACASIAMGVVYLLIHFSKCEELENKYEQSVWATQHQMV